MPIVYYDLKLTISDGGQNISFVEEFKSTRAVRGAFSTILTGHKDEIVGKFPQNQWLYPWIIDLAPGNSSETNVFNLLGVSGDQTIISALQYDSSTTIAEVAGIHSISLESY